MQWFPPSDEHEAIARAFAEIGRVIRHVLRYRRGEARREERERTWKFHAISPGMVPAAFYLLTDGRVLPLAPGAAADDLKGARLLRRADRRRVVGIKRWREGLRAPMGYP